MTCPAGKGDLGAGLAGDRLHHPQRLIFAFQQHALLDVELKEACCIIRQPALRNFCGIESERHQRALKGNAVAVFGGEPCRIQSCRLLPGCR